MMVRPKKRATPKGRIQPVPAVPFRFPAPIRGLVLNENIATPQPGGALVLDNWICTTKTIKARAGNSVHVTMGAAARTLFSYRSGAAELFFGATDTTIYNISTQSGSTPPSVVTGQTSGTYSVEQFGTAGGDFLYAVNGTDNAQLFDGATWTEIDGASTPAITGVSTSALSQVWSFANRLFFVEGGTLDAWYLPVDSIGGGASQFSLAGVFKKGGSLLFGATWSLDAGDGLDDKCVFVSTEGEIAVYEGTNPGSAADWSKVGVYEVSKPLGEKAIMQAGGDLLIATENGLVPISAAIRKDVAALEVDAVSYRISPYWQSQVSALGVNKWEIAKWSRKNIMIVSQPGDPNKTCLVANLQTGAWSRFTGIDTRCLGFFDDSVFFGDEDGRVMRMESGGADDGAIYTSVYLGQHEGMGADGSEKTVTKMRPIFQTTNNIAPKVTAQTDFLAETSLAPSAAPEGTEASVWDTAVWDTAIWDGGAAPRTEAFWQSVGRTGYAIAPEVQMTFGGVSAPCVELVAIDALYHQGAMVT